MQYLKEIQVLFLSSFEKQVFLPALPFRPVDPAQKKSRLLFTHIRASVELNITSFYTGS